MHQEFIGKEELLKKLKKKNPDISNEELEKIFDDLIIISKEEVVKGNVVGLVGFLRVFTKKSKRRKVKNLKNIDDFVSEGSRIVSVRVSKTLKNDIKKYDEKEAE